MKFEKEKISEDAGKNYDIGGLFCSEAILKAFNENLNMNLSPEAIGMASGFPVGVGKNKCMCGAVSGGVMVLGYFFGRTKGKGPKDEKAIKCLALSNEIISNFKKRNKVTCCSILTKGLDMASGEHKAQCVKFTQDVAYDVASILERELND